MALFSMLRIAQYCYETSFPTYKQYIFPHLNLEYRGLIKNWGPTRNNSWKKALLLTKKATESNHPPPLFFNTKGLLPPKVYYIDELTGQDRDIFVSKTEFRMKEVSRQEDTWGFLDSLLLLFSRSVMSNFFRPHGLQHARLPCPSLSQTHDHQISDASQPSHPPSSPSLPAFNLIQPSGFFPMSQLFTSGGQIIGASASVLPKNIQGWFPLGLTGLSPWCPRDSQES